MKLVLDLLGPPRLMGARRRCELRAGSLAVGRSPEADWVIPDTDRTISRIHLRIDTSHGDFVLTDTSVNGVYVNGSDEAVGYGASVRLREGDRLRIGEALVAVSIEGAQEASAGVPSFALDADAFAAQITPPAARDPLGGPFDGGPRAAPAAAIVPEAATMRPLVGTNWMNDVAEAAPPPPNTLPDRGRPVILPIRSVAPAAPLRAVPGAAPSVLALIGQMPGLPAARLAVAVDAAGQALPPAEWQSFHEKIRSLVQGAE